MQAIQRIEQHQIIQQQEMVNLTTTHQQSILRIEAKLVKQEEAHNQLLQQHEQAKKQHEQTLNQVLQQHEQLRQIQKGVAHLHNKQDQLADKQDILQSMVMKEIGVFRSPPVMSPASSLSRTPLGVRPTMPWPGFSPPQFPTPQFQMPQLPTRPPAIRASSCPPVSSLLQLQDDELTSILSDSYVSELSGVADDCLHSVAMGISSIIAPQQTPRQSLLTPPSDTDLAALLAGSGCPPQATSIDEPSWPGQVGSGCPPQATATSIDKPMHSGQVGSGCPPQVTSIDEPSHSVQVRGGFPPQATIMDEPSHSAQVGGRCPPPATSIDEPSHSGQVGSGCPPPASSIDEPSHSGQVGSGCPPQATSIDEPSHSRQVGVGCPPQVASIDEPSHSGQVGGGYPPQAISIDEPSHSGPVGGVTHSRKILKKTAAQVVHNHPELCCVAGIGTLTVKLARHSFFGDEVLVASSLKGKNGPPLNEAQLELLQNFVYNTVCPDMSLSAFIKDIWPTYKAALSNLCKRLRANLKAKTKGITKPKDQ